MKLARVGDRATGVCRCHQHPISVSGVISSGSQLSESSGSKVARAGDTVTFSCGHIGIIASGSSLCTCDGMPVARVGDKVVGCVTGVIVSGDSLCEVS